MGKTLIKVDCVDQRLIVTSAPTLASGGKNEDYVDFNFCDKWDGFEKVGVFYRDIDDPYKSTIDPTGRCVIPWEVLTSDGYIFFGAFGVKDDITRTTEISKYKVKLGAITEDLKPSDPTPELWEQILAGIAEQDAEMEVIREALSKKVDAVEGMGLSSNDYTDDDKLAIEQNRTDIEGLGADLSAFEKNRSFDLTGNPVQVESFEGMPLNPVTVLTPQQSGSGDPYPAGGGKNLLPIPPEGATISGITFAVNDDYSVRVSGTSTAIVTWGYYEWNDLLMKANTEYVISGSPADAPSEAYVAIVNGADARQGAETKFSYDEDTLVNVRIVVNSGVTVDTIFYPMIRLASDTDSTYAPPANIRPITGYDALDLVRAGKNLVQNTATTQTVYGVTYTVNADGSVTCNGTATADAYLQIDNATIVPPGKYLLSGGTTNVGVRIGKGTDNTFVGYHQGGNPFPVEFTEDTLLRIAIRAISGRVLADEIVYPMLRLASVSDATFAPYQGNAYTVQIGQTVYGGRMDWLTGKLTAEWGAKSLTGEETVTANAYGDNTIRFAISNVVQGILPTSEANLNLICSHYQTNIAPILSNNVNNAIVGYRNSATVYLRDDRFKTADELKASIAAQYAAGTPVQIAYKLATPVEIQLDAHEILALQGINTLYGDGEINISGRTDMQTVVSNLLKRIAALENKVNATE